MLNQWYKENHRPVDYKSERLAWYWRFAFMQGVVLLPLFLWLAFANPAVYLIGSAAFIFHAFCLKEPVDSVHQIEEWWRGNLPIWNWVTLGWRRELRMRGGK